MATAYGVAGRAMVAPLLSLHSNNYIIATLQSAKNLLIDTKIDTL